MSNLSLRTEGPRGSGRRSKRVQPDPSRALQPACLLVGICTGRKRCILVQTGDKRRSALRLQGFGVRVSQGGSRPKPPVAVESERTRRALGKGRRQFLVCVLPRSYSSPSNGSQPNVALIPPCSSSLPLPTPTVSLAHHVGRNPRQHQALLGSVPSKDAVVVASLFG